MEQPSRDVVRIVDECLGGKLLGHADAVRLCEIEAFTPDYYVLKYALRQLTFRASGGIAEVHGQIGMDANPCASGNCEFCSFAVMNSARPNEKREMPLDTIISYAKRYEEAGANCLTLRLGPVSLVCRGSSCGRSRFAHHGQHRRFRRSHGGRAESCRRGKRVPCHTHGRGHGDADSAGASREDHRGGLPAAHRGPQGG